MQKFWIMVALKALSYLTSKQMVESTKAIVESYIDFDAPGEAKRKAAYQEIRAIGYDAASWMINATIELALGYLKIRYPQLFIKRKAA